MLEFLPEPLLSAVQKIELTKLYELRLRVGAPVSVIFDFKRYFLGENYLTLSSENAIICTKEIIDSIIYIVTEYSMYASNERIKEGFITTQDGVRIGIAGECVYDSGKIIALKNFSSLCIRVPHSVIGCADKLYEIIMKNGPKSTLLISLPRYGKTTMLKDFLRKISSENRYDILVIDERGELADSNAHLDVIKFSDKNYAFSYGIRSLAPEIIVTDELSDTADWVCANKAVCSGMRIIATVHGASIEEVKRKREFIPDVFERYVVLEPTGAAGRIKYVYGKDYELI